jgi:aspartate aminotransferase-like enzyme
MQKLRLMTPGPTPVPPEVTAEMVRPMDHHRTAGHRQILREITEGLQYVFGTSGQCFVLTGSGTAGMESAIVGVCNPGGKALVVDGGKFGERWAKVCKSFGIDHTVLTVEWGTGVRPAQIAEALDADPKLNTVILVHSETSTAAVCDLEGIARITRGRDCMLVVDGITSVGALPVKMDAWGVDVMVTGSQKALMTPPGLAVVTVADRAWKRIDSFASPAFYNCLKAYRKGLADWDSPYTPAITLMMGLHKALEMIRAEGIEHVWKRTARLARATRAAGEAMGLKSFARDPSDSLTALLLPEGLDEPTFRKRLRSEHGLIVAGGQDQLKGRVIRINHMGYVDEVDTLGAIGAIELTLVAMGHNDTLGKAIAAAMESISAG